MNRRIFNGDNLIYAIAAILLATGLGASALLFTAFERLVARPLGAIPSQDLVRARIVRPKVTVRNGFSFDVFREAASISGLEDISAQTSIQSVAETSGQDETVNLQIVSGAYFRLAGVPAFTGRTLLPGEESNTEEQPPIVLDYSFWAKRFSQQKTAIGTTIRINQRLFTIVGVMPRDFYGMTLDEIPAGWVPFSAAPLLSDKSLRAGRFSIFARLSRGVGIESAQSQFQRIYSLDQIASGQTNPGIGSFESLNDAAFSLHDQFRNSISLMFYGLAAFLVLITANVASLLLSRAVGRERITAIKLALGATSGRLFRRDLLSSMLLALAGGGVGVGIAFLLSPAALHLLTGGSDPLPISLYPDAKVVVAVLGVALVLSLCFGTAPTWLLWQVAPLQVLRGGTASRKTSRLGRNLIRAQVVITFLLLASASFLLSTLYDLSKRDLGFDIGHLLVVTLDPTLGSSHTATSTSLPPDLEQTVSEIPGVRKAGLADVPILRRVGMKTSVGLLGTKIAQQDFLNTSANIISSHFLEAAGIPIVEGRNFTAGDNNVTKPSPAIVNRALARVLFPDGHVLGRTFGRGAPGDTAEGEFTVVGVAGDANYRSVQERSPATFYMLRKPDEEWAAPTSLYIRTVADPALVIASVRRLLSSISPYLSLSDITYVRELADQSLWQERMLAVVVSSFTLIALLMSSAGLYALISYDASRRTQEFAVRVALGSSMLRVAGLVFQNSMALVLPGLSIGVLLTLLVRLKLPTAISPNMELSVEIVLLTSGMLLLVGCAAAILPAVRVFAIDPAEKLRQQ